MKTLSIENGIFKRCVPDFGKALRYGFEKQGGGYVFEKPLPDLPFTACIRIMKDGTVRGAVLDTGTRDEYLPLRQEGVKGAYAASVRTAYEAMLTDIRTHCFIREHFIFPQSNRIAAALAEKYGDEPEFLWEKFSGTGVFRNPAVGKWYGIILNIDFSRLDKAKKGEIEVLNLKPGKDAVPVLLEENGFYPAWHMNKTHWISLLLDGTLPDEKIMQLLETSRILSTGKA